MTVLDASPTLAEQITAAAREAAALPAYCPLWVAWHEEIDALLDEWDAEQ